MHGCRVNIFNTSIRNNTIPATINQAINSNGINLIWFPIEDKVIALSNSFGFESSALLFKSF